MDWKELKHEINRKIVEFQREYGKEADTMVVGKEEYAVLKANKNNNAILDMYGEDRTFWSMKVRLDETKDSYLELVGKKVNFLKIVDYPFTPYRIGIDLLIPTRLRVPFVSFLDGQNASDFGVQIVGGGKEKSRINKDLVCYRISVKGPNKDMAHAFINYLYEIEKAYTIELTCVICGKRWFECRDTHYNNHLDGSKDFCKECKIHE